MSEINEYMVMYYETCIKEEAEHCMNIAQHKYEQTIEAERIEQELKKPTELAIWKETAADFWMTESEETKAEVWVSIETVYKEAMKM
jgi:hypothetical protein